ncbi:ABC transporter substrate-binding protein [Alteribacillus sp. HJP-4]|uniref:ABC transporter substrate-binding protein n=1 Tax=Alteribacillus sp. HJP-4 TaxID=2775394 RepID=UPI0035CD214C
MLRKSLPALISVLAAVLLTACGEESGNDGKVELELFNNKSENIDTYRGLIQKFEEENPDITIDLVSPPEAETVLRTRLLKNDMPDLSAMGGSALYGELAEAGVLMDYTDSELIDDIQPRYLDMLDQLAGEDVHNIHGVPFATNANTVIYNKEKLDELGEEVPKTWDEFIGVLEAAKEAGEVPIYFTLQEAWTSMIAWNALAGNTVPEDFAEQKANGEASFQENYKEASEKMLTLVEYGQNDAFGMGYSDGNNDFANGEGLFYLQGNWVIPELKAVNKDIELGVFAMPVNNDADENMLVSGVDVLLTAFEDTEHPEEAERFIEFMIEDENMETYLDEQAAFSAKEGIYEDDPTMEGIRENFEEGKITSFPDHYYPPGLGAENLIQEFLYRGNTDAFLKNMDSEWDKVEMR